MEHEIRARLRWVQLYHETGDAGLVCRRCGVSRPTLRKWVRRFAEAGREGLRARSRRPHRSAARKVGRIGERWILELRTKRKLGARRIQSELRRLHDCRLALATIHKVLTRHGVKPLRRRRRSIAVHRYTRPILFNVSESGTSPRRTVSHSCKPAEPGAPRACTWVPASRQSTAGGGTGADDGQATGRGEGDPAGDPAAVLG